MADMPRSELLPGKRILRTVLVDLAIMTVIGVVLALIGPFGSFAEPLPMRLVAWLGFAYLGYAIYSPMGWVVDRLHRGLDLPVWALWVGAVLVATVPMTVVVWGFNFLGASMPWPPLDRFLELYAYVLVIGGGITLLFNVIGQGEGRSEEAAVPSEGSVASEPAAPVSPFLDRLPPQLGTDLLALQMEDHYVRAHTALGSDLVLLRMRDAVAELGPVDGMQVHRSWWVARHAVEDIRREGRNLRLVLSGGLEAPVSRANVQVLKDAGWI